MNTIVKIERRDLPEGDAFMWEAVNESTLDKMGAHEFPLPCLFVQGETAVTPLDEKRGGFKVEMGTMRQMSLWRGGLPRTVTIFQEALTGVATEVVPGDFFLRLDGLKIPLPTQGDEDND